VRFLVTGATGFLGSRTSALLAGRGHEVVRLARPDGRERALAADAVRVDAADARARELLAGCDVVLHFAGLPDPARARADPAGAVRANAGTTVNLLEGCAEHDVALVYPSSVRAGRTPSPDPYALSKRLGEEACAHHRARSTVVRLTSVFGPGQVAWEGATGAIARFAAAALEGRPIVIPGNPGRVRDFAYVDDVVPAFERVAADGLWDETFTAASGVATPLRRVAELVCEATGSLIPIETPGGELERGEDESYAAEEVSSELGLSIRPLEEAIPLYVDWLRRHPAAQGRARS
jgi:UDP-glucose 4-epimerase